MSGGSKSWRSFGLAAMKDGNSRNAAGDYGNNNSDNAMAMENKIMRGMQKCVLKSLFVQQRTRLFYTNVKIYSSGFSSKAIPDSQLFVVFHSPSFG